MATYEQIYNGWQTEKLKKQVVIATLQTAQNVILEPVGTANHTARLAWAQKTILDPHLMALRMSAAVILNPTIQTGVYTDADILGIIAGAVNIFAAL